MQVGYDLLQVGQIPAFGRPEKGVLRVWLPTPHVVRALPAWKRLLLDDEGLTPTPTSMGWRRVAPPRPRNLNFIVELIDLDRPKFLPYLEQAAAALPNRRGSLVVILRHPTRAEELIEHPYLHFGLLHDPAPKYDYTLNSRYLAQLLPQTVSV